MACNDCEYNVVCFWALKMMEKATPGFCKQGRKNIVRAPKPKDKI